MTEEVQFVKGCCFCGKAIENAGELVRLDVKGPVSGGRIHAHVACLKEAVTDDLKEIAG